MWKLHRYYLKELAINAGITFAVLFAVVLVSLVARGLQRAQGGGLLDAALITLFFALDAFPHLLTIAFLVATVVTFTRAAQDRELIALRAAGIAPRVPMASAVLVGIVLSVLGSVAMHYVIPDVHYRKYRIIGETLRNMVIKLRLGSDRLSLGRYEMTFRAQEGDTYEDCTIYSLAGKPVEGTRSPIVRVSRVRLPEPEEESLELMVELVGVFDPIGGGALGNLRFAVSLDTADRRTDRDDDVQSDQLLAEVLRGVHRKPHEAVYTLFRRCCFALMPVVLAPIGYCIAEFTRERGRVLALVLALVPLGMFYLGEIVGARMLLSTKSAWFGWLPMVLLLAVGAPLCWRQLRR